VKKESSKEDRLMANDEVRKAERVIAENGCTSPEGEVAMKALLIHWAKEEEEVQVNG